MRITASILYNLVQCPHRIALDEFGNPEDRDPVDEFVQLLWERGNAYEREVVEGLDQEFVDMSRFHAEEREAETLKAMRAGAPLIYSARVSHGDLLGEPDLIRRADDGYVAGDIKSGAGYEGATDLDEGKPKKHYAVQLALYTDVLEKLGLGSPGRHAFVWDGRGEEVAYELNEARGPRTPGTWWEFYAASRNEAAEILDKTSRTLPALVSDCNLCHWRTHCRRIVEAKGDLSLIPELGRSTRDVLAATFPTVKDLAECDPGEYSSGKTSTVFPRIGMKSLRKFRERALLATSDDPKPYFKKAMSLPDVERELFFDLETDPMNGVCYLHGFVVREGGNTDSERFVAFMMEDGTPKEEERVFAEAVAFIRDSEPCAIYIYSKYERTVWKQLAQRYPAVASLKEIEELFGREELVDLYYDVVYPHMVWPTRNHSIKTLATYIGFTWRDQHPSGAASIKWYQEWCRTGDESVRRRILEYNEDDCRAMRVLLDCMRDLPVRSQV